MYKTWLEAYDEAKDLEQKRNQKRTELLFYQNKPETLKLKKEELQKLQNDYYVAVLEYKQIEEFMKYSNDVKQGKIKSTKNNATFFKYFNENLEPHQFQPAPSEAFCEFCGAMNSIDGIILTIDPGDSSHNKFTFICSKCYKERINEKTE